MNPVYSYRCRKCDKLHDIRGTVGDTPPQDTHCPNCGGVCIRVYRAPGVQYRGNGWTGAQGNRRDWKK